MKKGYSILILLCYLTFVCTSCVNAQSKNLKLVFIRHGEKPDQGDNLNCQGLNRSMQLPALLYKKFGLPANVYVPALNLGKVTKHTRMLQTISPFVIKYNLQLNSSYDVEDYKGIGKALLKESGTVIIVWEHQNIPAILEYLGINPNLLDWPGNDFDSIWVVTFANGKALLTKDKERLNPPAGCPF
jgi:hypothetical protein